MQKIIQQISQKFYEKLPKQEFYKLKSFASFGYPDFLIRHLQNTLQTKISGQITLPSGQWVNRDADEVQQTKQLFLNALYDETRLPADSAHDFIKKSVAEILKILVQPGQNIPEILFGENDVLTRKEIEDRIKIITVYQHFGQVLTGYMNRKQRPELTREQCASIIANVDEKLTQNYSPPQWTQLLNPLFALTDDRVDSQLFQLFFADKQMNKTAKMFEGREGKLSREEFIEVLSSVDEDRKPDEQKPANENLHSQVATSEEGLAANQDDNEPDEAVSTNKPKKKTKFSPPSPVAGKEEEKAGDQSPKTGDHETTAEKDENISVNTKFSGAEKQSKSLNDIFASRQIEKQEEKKQINQTASNTEPSQPKVETGNQKESSEVPIWRRFVDDEESDSSTNDEINDGTEKGSSKNDYNNEQKQFLKQHLATQERLFVDELFNGSKNEYERSIAKIAENDTWQGAVKTIQNDIFEKNNVNIYSSAAINFTDQLQNYFIKKLSMPQKD